MKILLSPLTKVDTPNCDFLLLSTAYCMLSIVTFHEQNSLNEGYISNQAPQGICIDYL